MKKWLEITYFFTFVFIIINIFLHFSRKKNQVTSLSGFQIHFFNTKLQITFK